MAESTKAFAGSSELNLWLKIRNGETLKLSDMPDIIPLRWPYFRDNWEFLKQDIIKLVPTYFDPDFLNAQIDAFTDFIVKQRTSSKQLNPFSDGIIYNRYYAIFDNITIDSINLTNDEQTIIDAKILTVQAYSKNDFLRIKKSLIDYRDRIADIAGLSDETYNHVYDKSSIPPQITGSNVEANLMVSVQENIGVVDFILANLFAVDSAIDPFALARSNANNPDINIGQYKSGRLVRMNYGEDLQGLANRYLGDPNKWVDIAIANGLKPPYIDEVGQKLSLLSNGQGNQINIGPTDVNGNLNIDKFYINQVILIQSNVQVFPEQRTITDIRQIPVSNEIILELDGEADLNKYKVSEGANIRVFAANTVNSSFYVLIPSEEPLDNNRQEDVPWFLAKSAADEKRQGIDLAIDDNGEINFGTNGDLKLSYGLDNAIQAMRLKIVTELGSLRYHPEFGLVNILGNKNQNLDELKALLVESLTNQIDIDSRFDRIENLDIRYLVGDASNNAVAAMNITVSVRLAGGSTVVPISFTVAK